MKEKIFLAFLVLLFFLSGCITPEERRVQDIPEVKSFLEEHPNAEVNVRLVRLTLLATAEAQDFKEKCGGEIERDSFYYATVISQDELMEVWLDSNSMEPLCIYSSSGGAALQYCQRHEDCDDENDNTFDECVLGECTHRTKTCKEFGGKICSRDLLCAGEFFDSYDTERCCFEDCIESLCEIIECGLNEVCVEGACVLLPCKDLNGMVCPEMQRCNEDVVQAFDTNRCCVAKCKQINPCSEVRCPEGMRCREGTCVSIGE